MCCGSYQNRFKFILVDEYQDTNVAQYLWLRLLSQAPSLSRKPIRRHSGARRRREPGILEILRSARDLRSSMLRIGPE